MKHEGDFFKRLLVLRFVVRMYSVVRLTAGSRVVQLLKSCLNVGILVVGYMAVVDL